MNTTKLHIIAKALKKEMGRVGSVSLVQQAVQALQNQINQPQQPNHQQQLSSHLTNLYKKLEGSPVDDFSPAWRDAMEELHVSEEFGEKLETRVRGIFERNQITPQTALEEMKKLHEDLSGTESQLTGLVSGLEYFRVGEDELIKSAGTDLFRQIKNQLGQIYLDKSAGTDLFKPQISWDRFI